VVPTPIQIQHLHLGLAAIDEDKILAAERIILQLIPDQGTQASERFAHVGGLGAQPDRRLAIEPDHPFWLSRNSTPLPRLKAIFQPEPGDSDVPISDDRSRKLE